MAKTRSLFVPYVTDRVMPEAVEYLPLGHDARLTAAKVSAFVEETDSLPDVRLAVLGVLRAHSMNGAETPTAVISVVFAALAVLISVVATIGGFGSAVGYAFGVGLVVLGGVFTRVAFTAHVRRMTCGVWLAAYEDALRR
ncbi:MAG TPA: hypothetical protein VN041_15855 [Microbacterium sp.]|nr:hypothetical protein [Microbacterium sp.]